ncbi:hypothetical protein OVY01_04275 [Robbsia sp. Bb-Pol-6]|uniref:Uncharacterized protein n=1 Tax=Robbsia betulipollinis TaxID=2981849 RepID=A0ABT3ZIY9_9BURK|nr:hypothetical protein [Robbsia betulipollinis]MCY0386470.1 hypothetical protein [Robbsia betulipollinis]
MKKVMAAVLAGACMLAASGFSTQAFAQITITGPAAAKKKAPKKAPQKTVKKSERRASRHAGRKTAVAAAPVAATMPAGAEKWRCDDNANLFLAGDMKRDQILTLFWDGRNYKLPRVPTTTGADRFYDPASGMDLVVIPVKAMLFNDRGDRTRLADECKTTAMLEQNAPAPTQANELLPNK